MSDGRKAVRRPGRALLQRRSRRRWAIAVGVAVCWLGADSITGSFVTATVLLVVIAGLGAAAVVGLRAMGITRDHPWLRRIASRPWRNGKDVLGIATRHLSDVFVVTPSGSLIAPDIVELQMHPRDLASLREWLELDILSTSLTEAYEDHVAKQGARFAGSYEPEVYIVPDDSIPEGRYRLRRGLPAGARPSPVPYDPPDSGDDQYANAEYEYSATAVDPLAAPHDRAWPDASLAPTIYDAGPGQTVMDGMATIVEQTRPAVPVLRLVTGSSVAETTMSGARAGRGLVELELPDVPTVSRVHATFTFSAGRWWVTNKGVNGLSVNGVPVSGGHPLTDGDSIRWGKQSEAPVSRVEIG